MKPAPFSYHAVRSSREATAVLGELGEDGRVLAGGQSLVPLMNFRLAQPEHLVDINPIDELSYVRRDNGRLVVGATARQAAVERSDEAREDLPLLVEAVQWVAHPTIRHRGTLVGSIAHADPAAELPCVAVALDASITLASAAGFRSLSVNEFLLGPFETALRPGELVSEVSFPIPPAAKRGHAFVEFARRHGDFAIAGVAVTLTLDGDRIADATIVLCGVGPRPIRAEQAEAVLQGHTPDADLVASVAQRATEGLKPGSDLHGSREYRVEVAGTLVRRAISLALERARRGTTT